MTDLQKQILTAKKDIYHLMHEIVLVMRKDYVIRKDLEWGHLGNLNHVKEGLKEIKDFIKKD